MSFGPRELPMVEGYPRLYADDRGVSVEIEPGLPLSIHWDEIAEVEGYKLDCITEVCTVIQLYHPSGHCLELNPDSQGFADVVRGITTRLPGIPSGWLAKIEALQPRDAPVRVWQRA
jgi:hypothetical protein